MMNPHSGTEEVLTIPRLKGVGFLINKDLGKDSSSDGRQFSFTNFWLEFADKMLLNKRRYFFGGNPGVTGLIWHEDQTGPILTLLHAASTFDCNVVF
jgi:hypothetical protein